jgi:DNA-binding IclR family transcriptional regulator
LLAIHAAEILTESVIEDPFGGVFHWRAIVLIEALYLKALAQDPKKIAKILRTTPSEIKSMIKKLVTLGVLKKLKNGVYQKSAFYFELANADQSKSLKTFRQQIKKLSLRRILPDAFFL